MAYDEKVVLYMGQSNNGVDTVLTRWKHDFLMAKVELAGLVGWDEAHRLMPEPRSGTATFVSLERYSREPGVHAGTFSFKKQWLESPKVKVRLSRVGNYVPFSNGLNEPEWSMSDEEIVLMFRLKTAPPRWLPADV